MAILLGTRLLEHVAGASASTVLYGQEVPSRLSRRRRFPRIDAYFQEYRGYRPVKSELPGHHHPWPELANVLEGRLNVVVRSTVYEARQGDWVVFAPGTSHTECCLASRKTYRLFWLVLLPDGQLGLHQTRYDRKAGYHVELVCHLPRVPPDLANAIHRLSRGEWDPLEVGRWEMINVINWCLSGLLGGVTETIDSYHPMAAEAKRIVEESTGRPPTVLELANRVGLSPNYLSGVFRRYSGQTIQQFAQRHWVGLACRHLADPSRKIKEISNELGFATPQHFTSIFHRIMGLTPTAYRQRLTEGSRPAQPSVTRAQR